jgi:signal transduction histidine kinase/ligand-binding sensor domain-containing protein/CheY-like chemotaxis protein
MGCRAARAGRARAGQRSGGDHTGASRVAIALLASALATPAYAERQTFRTVSVEEGLSQLVVDAMTFDTDGYLWIGTQAGLNRFDGQLVASLGSAEGLRHNHVTTLAADPRGGLWVGTDEGLQHLHDETFTDVALDTAPAVAVRTLHVGPDGRIWVADERGLYVGDGRTFTRITGIEGADVMRVLVDRQGTAWVASLTGLWRVVDHAVVRVEGAPAMLRTEYVTEDGSGRLWVATVDGVHVREHERWVPELTAQLNQASPGQKFLLYFDRRGELWLGDAGGVGLWAGGKLRRFGSADGLRLSSVASVVEDPEGRVWLGGFGGVAGFVGRAFTIYDETDGLPSANTRPVMRDRRGRLWVGTVRGVVRNDGRGFQPVGVPETYVFALYEDPRGHVWIGTESGLFVVTDEGVLTRPYGTVDKPVTSIVGRGDDVWLAFRSHGITHVREGRAQPLVVPDNPLSDARLLADSRGGLWVSGDLGLSVLRDGQWKLYGRADGLVHDRPYYLAEDARGHLWFGYRAAVGVTTFDGTTFRTFRQGDGLAHDAVYDLGKDRQGNMWIGSARGVDRYDGVRFYNYGPPEGFASTESNAGGFWADDDGTLWFGTGEGLCRFDPRLDIPAPASTPIRRLRVRLGEVELSRDGQAVPHDQSTLTASFDVLYFPHLRHMQVRARVVGHSEQWQPLVHMRLRVGPLSPGVHRLEIEARTHQREWTLIGSRSFTVQPPWWSTPWAVGGLVLALLALSAGAVRLRVMSLKHHNLRLTAMVEERTAVLLARTRELEEAQTTLRKTNTQLLAANRAKSEFITNISHDLRTPMNGILGMTEIALSEELSPEVREYLETVYASGQTLLELINEILDLSRVEAGRMALDPGPFGLRALLDELEGTLGVAARGKGLTLTMRVAPEVPDAWVGDARLLRRVIVNVVGNAVKFTQAGSVALDVDLATVPSAGAEQLLRFRVRDTGIGIPPDRLAAVFEMFTQADGSTTRRYGGSGLGLTISRQFVELMGGHIGVESTVGEGTTFTFTVALEPGEAAAPTPSRVPTKVAPSPLPLRVLVAEDNSTNQLVVRRMLEQLGHSVRLVDDGLQAVDAVVREDFDVVLMDLQMPGMDGLEATRRIRALPLARRVPIVALTAHGMATDREQTVAAGMDGYLTKPVTPAALAAALEPILGHRAA